MSDIKNKQNELDEFWNIDSLLPTKKTENKRKSISFDTNTTVVEIPAKASSANGTVKSDTLSIERNGTTITRFIPPHNASEQRDRRPPSLEYSSSDSLIRKVRIYDQQTKYHTTERFTADAIRYFKVKGSESPRVPFYSYSPQYAQMNKDQLLWYFWWRENHRSGNDLDTDYSYVLLYVYELINLSDRLNKDYCLEKLCHVWIGYGEKYPFIGKYLCEWVCDFCLINQLPPPVEKLKSIYPEIMKNALLKEFYIYGDFRDSGIGAETLMAMCSAYDYTKSRYATEERLPVMKQYMKGVLDRVIDKNSTGGSPLSGFGFSDSSVMRSSYTGAFCSPSIKKKIEIEYCSFSRSHELRYLVADVLRYTENKLRAAWGIRSRLSIYALPTSVRLCIDEYFDQNPIRRSEDTDKRGRRIVNEYDKLYDAPAAAFSAENAEKIEKASWNTTKILVEAFEDEEQEMKQTDPVAEKETIAPPTVEEESDLKSALGEKYEFLMAALSGDNIKQNQVAKRLMSMPDAIADEINEIAAELLGDIILEEEDNGGYRVIEEYTEVIK